MNKKLYSLFVFVYLIIVYCATVQGKKNVNGKNDRHEPNMIKKKYKKNYNKDTKYVQRTDEDGTDILKENNKESPHSISKEEKRRAKAEKIAKMHKAYAFSITSITALTILYFIRGYITNSLSNPNSNTSKLIRKAVDIKNKKP
ncbi:hypothetical protein YYG_05096 [Plasmodium vinckei petteri]|uniref:Uncharacterized protein n=1 Tax=Plasmodium vinckei petteri TaxID=138298 RepID=W7A8X9_PLAVN|nr:hypothetical protein YYG_05096 [Plasmodium vinckei petteri]CAD2110675.1 conserved rodent malaria protein, unknown function [Plasmodium vinckei petteri]